eukprot:TRINITY_DN30777_c0_g1_i1.p1 TRINITY_DN30777_c0_g1~~TRINITY_DN30777_c0_g1_i1.p1  ORF type:complete len:232 (+),score=89.05 TRINITY_DN30777_c0_g1_i1:95-697(+)
MERQETMKEGCMDGGDDTASESSSANEGGETEAPEPSGERFEIVKPNHFIEKGDDEKKKESPAVLQYDSDAGGEDVAVSAKPDPVRLDNVEPAPDLLNTPIEAMEEVIAAELGSPLGGSGEEGQVQFDPRSPLPADVDALIDEELGYDPVDHILKEKRRELLLQEETRKAQYEHCLHTLDGTIAAQDMVSSFDAECAAGK